MEAGPYLCAVYEATYPERHPLDDAVHFRDLPFDVGFIHYASDTPYTRARTLGSRRLSFEGIDSTYAATVAITRRILEREAERGITTIPPTSGFDVTAQVIDLCRVQPEDLDPRLEELAEVIGKTDAVILNVDYPLGMAAYYIGRQIAERIVDLRGFYVLGKAATLNGAVGDVMFADEVFDEHTGNIYSFPNAFGYDEVAPWLEQGSALDRQHAVTVRGTFLQNREYLELFYREAYTIVEMEAGPYLSAIYEATYPERHPLDDAVHFRDLPFDVGFIHYASDTPYTRARTLGSRRLSFEGIDSTYASTVAITRRILTLEAERLGLRR